MGGSAGSGKSCGALGTIRRVSGKNIPHKIRFEGSSCGYPSGDNGAPQAGCSEIVAVPKKQLGRRIQSIFSLKIYPQK
jgi:hypothetical protein